MARLIKKVLLLAAPFIILLGAVEYRLRRIPNGYSRMKEDLERQLPTIEILFLGSSHAQNAFDPSCFDVPAFNLGYGSQSLAYDAKLVEKYAPLAPKLKRVVFTISYFSLESRLDRSIESWRSGFYRQVYGISAEDAESQHHLSDYSYLALYTPREAYSLVFHDLFDGARVGTSSHDGEGARLIAGGGDVSDSFGAARLRFHEASMYPSFIRYNRDALETACKLLGERGVAVTFVTTPVHHSYSDHFDPVRSARMHDNAIDLARVCHGEYLDYGTDARFSSEDFINSDHLNSRGARKFSSILNQHLFGRPCALDRVSVRAPQAH